MLLWGLAEDRGILSGSPMSYFECTSKITNVKLMGYARMPLRPVLWHLRGVFWGGGWCAIRGRVSYIPIHTAKLKPHSKMGAVGLQGEVVELCQFVHHLFLVYLENNRRQIVGICMYPCPSSFMTFTWCVLRGGGAQSGGVLESSQKNRAESRRFLICKCSASQN
jgi:hypothetical protein